MKPIHLPTRDSLKRTDVTLQDVAPIAAAYVRGELMTRAEWFTDVATEAALTGSMPPDSLRPDSHGEQETT